MTRSHPVFVKPLFAEMKAAVAGVADMPLESPQMPASASQPPEVLTVPLSPRRPHKGVQVLVFGKHSH